MSKNISLIVADDHLLFIEGLQLLLKQENDITILNFANDGRELLNILKFQLPDIVLLDINMPGINGLETARYLKQSYPSVKIIMLSTYNENHLIEKAKNYGTNGYLLKNSSRENLLQTIRLVANGNNCFPYTFHKTFNEYSKSDSFLKQFNLTKREIEIIQYIKKGFTNQQIANELYLSIYTIETHRKNIMQKLGLNSPTALMKYIVENNI